MEIMCGSITSSPRGLASFWSSHFIHDLVATPLLSVSGLAAEIPGNSETFAYWMTMAEHLWTLLALIRWIGSSTGPRNAA